MHGCKKYIIKVLADLTNYCISGVHDVFGHCCVDGYKSNGICVSASDVHALRLMTTSCNSTDNYYCPEYPAQRQVYIYCMTTDDYINYDSQTETYSCENGSWVLIDQYGNYFDGDWSYFASGSGGNGQTSAPSMTYTPKCNDCGSEQPNCPLSDCTYNYNGTSWSFGSCTGISGPVPKNHEFKITY